MGSGRQDTASTAPAALERKRLAHRGRCLVASAMVAMGLGRPDRCAHEGCASIGGSLQESCRGSGVATESRHLCVPGLEEGLAIPGYRRRGRGLGVTWRPADPTSHGRPTAPAPTPRVPSLAEPQVTQAAPRVQGGCLPHLPGVGTWGPESSLLRACRLGPPEERLQASGERDRHRGTPRPA